MKRFETIYPLIQNIYASIHDFENASLCKAHHHLVLEEMKKLTDSDILYTAALLHDIGMYLGLRGPHAHTSADYAKTFLESTQLFTDEEIQLIHDIIYVHSDKKSTHFFEAELLKQADAAAHLKEL